MDEILYELRDHSSGLNCGRWDYIFSFIKKFRAQHGLRAARPRQRDDGQARSCARTSQLLIKTCHRRGIHAMGGMAAQIPIKNDAAANEAAMAEGARRQAARSARRPRRHLGRASGARADREGDLRRAHAGAESDRSQARRRAASPRADLLRVPEGAITEQGFRQNINVGILYLEAWLGGLGCVPLYNLMEDAATAEISRTQLWQWIHHHAHARRRPRGDAASSTGRSATRSCTTIGSRPHLEKRARRSSNDLILNDDARRFPDAPRVRGASATGDD